MVLIPLDNIGKYGIVKDIKASQLPLGAWSDARNVQFSDDGARKGVGRATVRATSVEPYYLALGSLENGVWLYAGAAKVKGFDSSSEADITKVSGDYTGTPDDLWNGGMLNGIPVLNNGVDSPQMWSPATLATKLVNLTAWPAVTTTRVLRPFKNYLVALDVTKSGTRYNRMVKWSHAANPGFIPSSWDETNATLDAGEDNLSEGEDDLKDCLPLGDTNVIYTELGTWSMRLSGTPFVFNFNNIFRNSGILTQDCARQFKNNHFVVTQDDIVVHDGQSVESVVSARLRKWFFNNLSSEARHLVKVEVHHQAREIWVCFSLGATTVLNTALVWNWVFNTWSIYELPGIRCVMALPFSGSVVGTDITWEEETVETWDVETAKAWDVVITPGAYLGALLIGSSQYSRISRIALDVYQFDGSSFESYVERKALAPRLNQRGDVVQDASIERMLLAIWPRFEAADGTQFKITVGTHEHADDDVTWGTMQTYTVGSDPKLDMYATGRYLAIKISCNDSVDWRLSSLDMDVVEIGAL